MAYIYLYWLLADAPSFPPSLSLTSQLHPHSCLQWMNWQGKEEKTVWTACVQQLHCLQANSFYRLRTHSFAYIFVCMCVSECVSAWVLSDQARGQPSLLKFVFLVVVDTWVLAHLSACSTMLGSPKQSGYRRSGQEHCRWVGGCIPVVELHFIKIIPSPHYNSTSLHVFTRGPTKRLKYVPGCCYSGGMLMCC